MAYLADPMSAVVVFTVVYTIGLFAYGSVMDSSLTSTYTGIDIGLFVLFGILHRWARWPARALWAASLMGLGKHARRCPARRW